MEFNLDILATCGVVILARVVDVSLGTLRVLFVVHGRRGVALVLGFTEVLVWVFAVAQVLTNLSHPLVAVSYALGFALGNFLGMTVERWFAIGEQAVRIFTRQRGAVAAGLREQGWRVTEFEGAGRDGPVFLLFVQAPRRDVPRTIERARQLDPNCYYVVDDVRAVSTILRAGAGGATRGLLVRK
ncbi:MAG: DUF5698 domain-containing protein [Phycisphaerae bacterium]|nr:DUF2179 domain-containing protein [Phycisphaerae bacterium]MCZ2401199.1 DUF5698 domain-containing protein [Phycisphaerae bacterium]NUQ48771.1 DUF2179 domain-containing protein [Phycisphaerae bacterium]